MSLMAGAPSLTDLVSTYFCFVSAVAGDDTNGTAALPLPVVQLALFVLVLGFAVLLRAHPLVWPNERSPSDGDAQSVILIVMISFLSLLALVWAVFFGPDPGAGMP